MLGYNLEQRRLLFYPHKFIPYTEKPKSIALNIFDLAYVYWECQLEVAITARKELGLEPSSILKEYKQWVDSIDLGKIVSVKDQGMENLRFELQKTRKTDTYLYKLYKNLVYSKILKKLTRTRMNYCNPMIKYHIDNYHSLHNFYRESPKNYFIPSKFIENENI